ncbi:DNA/RNA non-specific endonuclease [Leucobacter denitrificans]|uniref:DNA/RNA non-specific endonuclease n=1 Tax=Leucobacter denitrificans TaxID=683042 RepID=A0A7G9S7C6_9MICO|nr:DNA/RNA non-specific endonuclease [Leucobacter denitrificans]QNN63751.1 DNA/RNA non-specific endonuclease [Leucobacter denitrificans]
MNTAAFASDAEQVGAVASRILTATTTAGSALLSCAGMAGIDPMAEEFALGTKTGGGYDLSAASMLESGVTLAKAVATFEGRVLGLAAAYRAMELVGLGGGSNPYATLTPTQITASPPSVGSSLGDEQRGTPQGEIMEWVENFLKDTAGIVIPTADTGKITQAADAWDAYAGELTTAKAELEAALPLTLASEFPQRGDVTAVHTKLSSLIDDLAADAREMSEGCAAFAKSVGEIRAELLEMLGQLAAEIALDIGLGAVLSLVSFGAGAVAAAGKAALTVARWVPKLIAVINRLKTLIQSAKRTMAAMRRASIEAIESAVSGAVANATASAAFGNFSWDDVGGAAVSSAIGGAIAGPFSHIGSSITSRGARVTTRATVDGVTGGVGGVAGEFAASQVTGQDFNLLMSTLVGAAGGAAGGGLTSIKNPSVGPSASLTNAFTAPSPGGAAPATTSVGGTSLNGSPTTNAGAPSGGAHSGGASAPGAPAIGPDDVGSGAPTAGGSGSASGSGGASGPSGAGSPGVPQSNVEVPTSLGSDGPDGGDSRVRTNDGVNDPDTAGDGSDVPGGDAPESPNESHSHPGPGQPADEAGVEAGARPPTESALDHSSASDTNDGEKPPRRSASEEYPPPEANHRIEVENPGSRTQFPHDGLEPNTAYVVEGRGTYYTDASGTVTHVETDYGPNSAPNPDLNHPAPNTTYVVNDRHVFVTDALSRTVEVHVPRLELIPDTPRSSSIQRSVGQSAGPGHDGGHLIQNAAGGGRERINIVAMLEELNRSVSPENKLTENYYDFERLLRGALNDKSDVRLDLYVRYDEDTTPTRIDAEYSIDGEWFDERFDNVRRF